MHDYHTTGLSLKAHPVSFLRDELSGLGVTPAAALRDENAWPNGRPITVAGLVLIRQRPGTASGIVFMTIEDETGIVNLIVRPKVFERYRKAAHHGVIILARGKVERASGVVHVMVSSIHGVETGGLTHRSRDFR